MDSVRPLASPFRVVVTRPVSQAQDLLDALADEGLSWLSLPVIETQSITLPGVRERLAELVAGRFDWLVCTSANGPRYLAELLPGPLPSPLCIACQGGATGRAVVACLGRDATIVGDGGPQEELAQRVVKAGGRDGKAVLVVGAEVRRSALEVVLRAAGAAVATVAVYRTVAITPTPEQLQAVLSRDPGQLVFPLLSPSAVMGVRRVLGDELLRRAVLVPFGPVTADACRSGGLSPRFVYGGGSLRGFASQIADLLAQQRDVESG